MPNIKRLIKLRLLAQNIMSDKLTMWDWTDYNNECGTTHCLGGWMALDPWFQKNTGVLKIFKVDGDDVDVYWNGLWTHHALAEMFDISDHDAMRLFDGSIRKKTDVLREIDRLISSGESTGAKI